MEARSIYHADHALVNRMLATHAIESAALTAPQTLDLRCFVCCCVGPTKKVQR